jgi:hypothetical protein
MKIGIIGCGTAGLLSAVQMCNKLPNFFEIHLIYSNKIDIIGVGESSLLDFPEKLYYGIDYIHFLDSYKLDSTIKHGVKFKNWSDDDFYIPFNSGSYGIHFDNTKLKSLIIPRLKNKYSNFHEHIDTIVDYKSNGKQVIVNCEYKSFEFDYLIDCSGFPKDFSDYEITDYVYLNSAIILTSKNSGNWEYTYHYAHQNGWMFGIPLKTRHTWGYLYNSNITKEEECFEDIEKIFSNKNNIDGHTELKDLNIDNPRKFSFKNYYCKNIINDDCNIIKNGNAALFFEPIQATSIGFYGALNDLIIDMILDNMTPKELDQTINSLVKVLLVFINYHYLNGSKYETPFWKYSKSKSFEFIDKFSIEKIDKITMIDRSLWKYFDDYNLIETMAKFFGFSLVLK